jgi:hypothetical protein
MGVTNLIKAVDAIQRNDRLPHCNRIEEVLQNVRREIAGPA